MMAVLVPCLVVLRDEFNAVFPNRDKRSDGWIADALHDSTSDHQPDEESAALRDHDADSKNEVHALDVDEDVRDNRTTMREAVDEIHRRHRLGLDNRLTYIIYEGRIASASRGWAWRDYDGANPHDRHGHFSASYTTSRESDTRPWGVAALARREDRPVTSPTFPTAAQIAEAVHNRVIDRPDAIGADASLATILAYLGSRETIATRARDVILASPEWQALENRLESIDDKLTSLLADPEDRDGGGEADPIVRKIRYANANPPAAE